MTRTLTGFRAALLLPLVLCAAGGGALAQVAPGVRVDAAIGLGSVLGRWPGTVSLVYDPDGAPVAIPRAALTAALEDATGYWETVSGVRFAFVGTDRDAPADAGAPRAERDGVVRLAWAPLDEGIATQTQLFYGDYLADRGYFAYEDGGIDVSNRAGAIPDAGNLRDRLVTALGSLLGLGGAETPNSVLFTDPANFLRYPRENDIRALRVLYGPGTGGEFDPARPVAAWQYEPPSNARPSLRRALFHANAANPHGARFLVGEDEVAAIDAGVGDEDIVLLDSGGIGAADYREAIAVSAEVVLVDPFGYEHHRGAWSLACAALTACEGSSVAVAEASILKTLPGVWRVYVVDVSRGWREGSLLHAAELRVTAQPEINHAPEVTVRAEPGLTPGSVTFVLAASDPDGDAIAVIWHPPGAEPVVESLGPDGLAVETVHFGLAGAHSMFVELVDDGARYDTAGAGFQTLVRLDVKLPFGGAADDFVAVSSANAEAEADAAVPMPLAVLASIVERGAPSAALATTGTSTAVFWLGASQDEGLSTAQTFAPDDSIVVAAAWNPQAADLGQGGELFVVIHSQPDAGGEAWSQRDTGGSFVAWNGDPAGLRPAYTTPGLQDWELREAFAGHLPPGRHEVYLAYRRQGSPVLHVSAVPLVVSVPL